MSTELIIGLLGFVAGVSLFVGLFLSYHDQRKRKKQVIQERKGSLK